MCSTNGDFNAMAAFAICNELGYNVNTERSWSTGKEGYSHIQELYDLALTSVACETDDFALCTYNTTSQCGQHSDVFLSCGKYLAMSTGWLKSLDPFLNV